MEGYGRYLQEVYLHSPGDILSDPETLAIPARWDAEAGYPIVLLSDVQLVFKNAHRFLDNGEIVPFLKDNGLQELIPLRIKYRHGAILQVSEANTGEHSTTNTVADATIVENPKEDPHSHGNPALVPSPGYLTMPGMAAPSISQTETLSNPISTVAEGQNSGVPRSYTQFFSITDLSNTPSVIFPNFTGTVAESQGSGGPHSRPPARPHVRSFLPSPFYSTPPSPTSIFPNPTGTVAESQGSGNGSAFEAPPGVYLWTARTTTDRLSRKSLSMVEKCIIQYLRGLPMSYARIVELTGFGKGTINRVLTELNGQQLPPMELSIVSLDTRTFVLKVGESLPNQGTGMSGVQSNTEHSTESTDSILEIYENWYQQLKASGLIGKTLPMQQDSGEAQSNKQGKDQLMLEKQQQILQAEQRDIDRLVTEQEAFQDAVTLLFASQECPFPRLFIALPVATATTPLTYNHQTLAPTFRLFFLCEGDHQSIPEEPTSPVIHLARHEGYELRDPERFFRDYTPYLVSMIHILKNGIASPRLNIPSLSHLTLADGVDEVQGILDLANNTIQSLMDETMLYISYQGYYVFTNRMSNETLFDVVESTDPRSIVECLSGCRGDERNLGNLSQVITSENDPKWICSGHYRAGYRGVALAHQDEENTDNEDEENTDNVDEGNTDSEEEDIVDEQVQLLDVRNQGDFIESVMFRNLKSMRWTVREKAVVALHKRAEQDETVIQALVEATADRHWSVKEAAVRVLRGPSKVSHTALKAVINAVNDDKWNVGEAAVQVLGDLLQLSREIFDVLVGAAGSAHIHVKRAAIEALVKHTGSEAALQYLVETIRIDIHMNKVVAMDVLASQIKLSEAVVEALINTLGDGNQEVRNSAANALQSQSRLPKSAIQILLEKVQDEDSDIREAAIRALGNQISVSESVIPALITGLQDDNSNVQEAAVQVLGDKSDLPQSTIHELARILSHERVSVREVSAKVLGGQGNMSEAMIQALIGTLNDEAPSVREAAVQALGSHFQQSPSVIDTLVSMLDDDDPKVRGAAVYSLGCKMKLPESAVQALIKTLDDQHVYVQQDAIQVLGGLTASSSEVFDGLLRLLENENQYIRTITINALSGTVQLSESAMEKLITNLQDKRPHLRRSTVEVLSSYTKRSETAVNALADAASDIDLTVSYLAVNALRGQVKLSELAVRKLIAANKQTYTRSARLDVVQVLSGLVNSSEDAVKELIRSLRDPSMTVVRTAENALSSLTSIPDSALEILEGLLHDDDWLIKSSALIILSKHVQTSEAAALTALHALRHPSQHFKDTALGVLHKNGLPVSVVLTLLEMLRTNDRNVRDTAVIILCGLPNMSKEATQTLIEYLKDDDKVIRNAAARALKGQVKHSKDTVQALTVALSDLDSDVRLASVMTLDELRDKANPPESTILRLIALLKDSNSDVRGAASGVLRELRTLPGDSIQVLIPSLKDDDKEVRMVAAHVLGTQAKWSEDAVTALTKVLNDVDAGVRNASVTSLRELCHEIDLPGPTIQELVKTLKDSNAEVRITTEGLLSGMSDMSGSTIQALIGYLKDHNGNKEVRMAAARVLGRQVKRSKTAVQALTSTLEDKDKDVRQTVVKTLGGLVVFTDEIIHSLIDVLQDEEITVRQSAMKILMRRTTLPEADVMALVGAMRDQRQDVSTGATTTLRNQTAISENARKVLEEYLNDDDWGVRKAAAQVLYSPTTPADIEDSSHSEHEIALDSMPLRVLLRRYRPLEVYQASSSSHVSNIARRPQALHPSALCELTSE
ncbi:MAG: armadillo-type protein [Benniella sp.]|nr:MAG: armadillo-type protein [Benniella sp.]